ncbi:MAG: HAD hydrolase family protein [Phycisphaerales bacterium]|nr:HAD hydrolase family protein [Phycisphaerales bacterium]
MPHPATRIQLLCLDVDGVLTDGSILIDDRGVETKRFNVRDGAGMRIWTRLGNEIAVITARKGLALRHRLHELGIRHVISGAGDKGAAFGALLQDLDLRASQAAMIGDDLADLAVLTLCGYPIAVADAVDEVREAAAFVTSRPGGRGAVREAIEHLLHAQDRWDEALALYR